jgi:hypothetical protein
VQSIHQETYLEVFEQKLHSLQKLTLDLGRGLPPGISEDFKKGLKLITEADEIFLRLRVENLKTIFAGKPQELEAQITFHAKVALQILGAIHQQYLPLLHAETQRNEYLIYPSIERALRLFVAADGFELTLVPSFEYNYAFEGRENFASNTIKSLEGHSDQGTREALAAVRSKTTLKRWITFLHFPVADRDSALNLCVLAHELGHLVDQANKIYEKLLPIELDKASFDEMVDVRCKARAVGSGPKSGGPQLTFESIFTRPGVQAQCYKSCNEVLERWIQEIIADVLAIHAIGPASYFAFNDFFAYMGAENNPSKSHPAPAFRLQLMLEELKGMGYMGSPSEIDSVLSQSLPRVEADAKSTIYKKDEAANVVKETIQQNLPGLLAKIRPYISGHSFNAPAYTNAVPKLLKKLKAGIAPIEVWDEQAGKTTPASVVAILNAGWELYKTDIAGFYDLFKADVPEMDRLGNLNQLIFKAVEASEIFRGWK